MALGRELRRGPLRDIGRMRAITRDALAQMGIDLRDVDQPVGTLSGGARCISGRGC